MIALKRFIYVFNEDDKNTLIQNGFALLKSDDRNNIYVFENSGMTVFSMSALKFALSDTLTF